MIVPFRTLLENWNRSFSTWRVKTQRMSYVNIFGNQKYQKRNIPCWTVTSPPSIWCPLNQISQNANCYTLDASIFWWIYPNCWSRPGHRSPVGIGVNCASKSSWRWLSGKAPSCAAKSTGAPKFPSCGFSMGGVTVLFPWVFPWF